MELILVQQMVEKVLVTSTSSSSGTANSSLPPNIVSSLWTREVWIGLETGILVYGGGTIVICCWVVESMKIGVWKGIVV